MGLKIKIENDPKEWVEQMPEEIFDPSNDKSNPMNHGWRKSDFTRKMDDETKKFLWNVMAENSELKQQLMMVENKLEQIKRLF